MKASRSTGALFAGVVGFLLLLIGWWIYFLVQESFRLDTATELARRGDHLAALRELGATEQGDFSRKAQAYRLMFTTEGTVMGLLILAGVFLLYRAILREGALRRDQERFLTGATHRLKTPLATVRLGIESIRAGTMPLAKREHYLAAMLREIDRLENDVTNVLTAGGLEASGKGLRLTPGDLSADVRDAARTMEDRFAAADVDLKVQTPDTVMARRDGSAIRLVVHNLLDNAAKFSPAGSTVRLELSRHDGRAHIRVEDQGPGIPAADLPHIFERFYRSDDHQGGSGIGLFLVKQLIDSHGGTVHVSSSDMDSGSAFRIEIPALPHGAS